MSNKLMYVTKKQVSNFIKKETQRLGINNQELLKEVELVLVDLKQFPNDNLNQIKFYIKIKQNLNQ